VHGAGGGVRIGVVGTPGAWSTERLVDAFRAAGAAARVVDLAACSLRLPDPAVYHRGAPLAGLDAVVVKKIGDTADGWAVRERLNLLRRLEDSGVPVLSAPDRLEVAVDRYRMTLELARGGLPVPETVITEDLGEAAAAVERFGVAVLKPLFTSKGRGMCRLEPAADLGSTLARLRVEAGGGPLYLQRFVKHPGRDLGIAVLDGRCLGAYWRVAAPDRWMTTVHSGGRYEPAAPPREAVEMAVGAASRFGLIFTGVDLIEGPGGEWRVLEVSAFGGFRGLLEACGVDAASLLAETVLRRVEPTGGAVLQASAQETR
jgi:tetrahydromethanopterin:alpha-L-glutamate ligase